MLKVEDGCHNFCSYCIIPYARGPVRSLPWGGGGADRALRREGYREIVLTGIEISSWGEDLRTGERLIDLLEAISPRAGTCASAWGAWSPGPSPRTSAAGRRPCQTSAPTSTCPCSPAVMRRCAG